MRLERESSGVAKAGLATGITGAALGAINALGGIGSIIGGHAMHNAEFGCGVYGRNAGCCNEDHLVDRYEVGLLQKIAEKDTQIALRDANTFTDQKQLEMYKYVDGRLRAIEEQLCKQEVKNQATSDSIQLVNERMRCCCDSLETKINNECKERKCADNTIVTYANATFYPKQVASVTTGTTTTSQILYNPLPVENCGNCC